MAKSGTAARAAPLYYLAIDGTADVDSVTFSALLEQHRGWKNLATTYLEPRADDPGYLVDPLHPFLPIPRVSAHGRTIAVVAPGGKDCKGKDSFWRHVNSMADDVSRHVVVGRHAEAEKGSRFMRDLILRPAVDLREDRGTPFAHFTDGNQPAGPRGPLATASLVYVSGHGWMGGYINGGELEPWKDASDPVTPPPAQEKYFPSGYFYVGSAAAKGKGFHGPRWVVLAVCSVLNMATWPLWAEVLAHSSPPVRGILAYEESSPKARPAAGVAREFFGHLDAGVPFLDAWRIANQGKNWSAIVHKDALHDTLGMFRMLPVDGDTRTTTAISNYVGFGLSVPNGKPIFLQPEPFSLKVERETDGHWHEVLPGNLGHPATDLRDRGQYRITVSAPAGERLTTVRLQLIHIRPTYQTQFGWGSVFDGFGTARDVNLSGQASPVMEIRPANPSPAVSVQLYARGDLTTAGLERGYSYLWVRASIDIGDVTLRHDFKINGLCYQQ